MPPAPRNLVSAIRATGRVHVGNLLGALEPFARAAREPGTASYFAVADLHTLGTVRDPVSLRREVPAMLLDLLGAGIDPAHTALFVQSHVPATSELAWLLANVSYVSELERAPDFRARERDRRDGEPASAALLAYPLLMAADVLGLRADVVAVGEDQYPHLELVRDIARRFNRVFVTSLFAEPVALGGEPVRVPGLDGSGKMGKSAGGTLAITDSAETRAERLAAVLTEPGAPERCTVFDLHRHVSDGATVNEVREACSRVALSCADCKSRLNTALETRLTPVRERRAHYERNPDEVRAIVAAGTARARTVIEATRDAVRTAAGLDGVT